jgi:hypothetical protein
MPLKMLPQDNFRGMESEVPHLWFNNLFHHEHASTQVADLSTSDFDQD